MRPGLGTLAFLLTLITANADAQEGLHPFLRVESRNYSEPVSVREAFDLLEADDFEGGENAFTHNEIEAGVQWRDLSISAVYRQDWFLRFSEDLAELVFRQVNDRPIPEDRLFDLEVGADHIEGSGVRVAWQWDPTEQLTITPRVTLLRTLRTIEGSGVGSVRVLDGRYTGSAEIDHRYTEDELLGRNVRGEDGWGATLDLSVEYRPTDELFLSVALEDALSRIEWDDLPRTRARVESGSARLDADGNLIVQPLLSGIETFDDHAQELPRRVEAQASWRFDARHSLWVRHHRIAGEPFSRIGATLHRGTHAWSLGVDIEAQALLLGWLGPRWGIELGIDDVAPDDAGLIDIALHLRL